MNTIFLISLVFILIGVIIYLVWSNSNTKESLNNRINLLREENIRLEAKNSNLKEGQEKFKKEIAEMQSRTQLEFKEIANKIFEDKSIRFTQINKDNIESLLKPLENNIKEFRNNIDKNLTEETKQRTSLEENIKKILEQTNLVSLEANNLASALKSNNKKQGNWGENILETILEYSGLIKGIHYTSQTSFKDEDNKLKRPDIIVNLPDNRGVIVIDSKVSLIAYDRYFSCENSQEQNQYLIEHIKSIRSHIDDLSSKRYEEISKNLDFTLMFIPIESAYLLAMQNDKEIWEYAYKKKIILVSATNLISSLRIISDLWIKDKQDVNAKYIINETTKIYDKLVSFLTSFEEIGKSIENTNKIYLKAMGQLNTGKGNLIGRANKLKELGINSEKNIPEKLINYQEFDFEDGKEEE